MTQNNGSWEVLVQGGRERTGIDVIDWIKSGIDLGAGEILLTSVDQEGTRKGFDNDLISSVANTVRVPIISSGGMGEYGHIVSASSSGADAIAIADFLHYRRGTIGEIRSFCKKNGLEVRNY